MSKERTSETRLGASQFLSVWVLCNTMYEHGSSERQSPLNPKLTLSGEEVWVVARAANVSVRSCQFGTEISANFNS